MKKCVKLTIIMITICIHLWANYVYAVSNDAQEALDGESTAGLVELKEENLNALEDYKRTYGSDKTGITEYIKHITSLLIIPVTIIGIPVIIIAVLVIILHKRKNKSKKYDA